MARDKKRTHQRPGNPIYMETKMKNGGGFHKHPKWEEGRKVCRRRIDLNNVMEEQDLEVDTGFEDELREL